MISSVINQINISLNHRINTNAILGDKINFNSYQNVEDYEHNLVYIYKNFII